MKQCLKKRQQAISTLQLVSTFDHFKIADPRVDWVQNGRSLDIWLFIVTATKCFSEEKKRHLSCLYQRLTMLLHSCVDHGGGTWRDYCSARSAGVANDLP